MLKLYYATYCPYCAKVIKNFNETGVKYELINAEPDTEGRDELVKLGGKAQIPFLVDGNTMMYESNDIIEYARKNRDTSK